MMWSDRAGQDGRGRRGLNLISSLVFLLILCKTVLIYYKNILLNTLLNNDVSGRDRIGCIWDGRGSRKGLKFNFFNI